MKRRTFFGTLAAAFAAASVPVRRLDVTDIVEGQPPTPVAYESGPRHALLYDAVGPLACGDLVTGAGVGCVRRARPGESYLGVALGQMYAGGAWMVELSRGGTAWSRGWRRKEVGS